MAAKAVLAASDCEDDRYRYQGRHALHFHADILDHEEHSRWARACALPQTPCCNWYVTAGAEVLELDRRHPAPRARQPQPGQWH